MKVLVQFAADFTSHTCKMQVIVKSITRILQQQLSELTLPKIQSFQFQEV